MYKITLGNGVELENLELNGNNYIYDGVIEDSVFDGSLDTVVITDGENEATYTDMYLMSNRVCDGKTWFVLGEKDINQKLKEENEALTQMVAALQNELVNTQLALCDVYEQVIASAGTKEV